MASGPKLKYTIYIIIKPVNLLTKYSGEGENNFFMVSFSCMNFGLKSIFITVITDEKVININTNKLAKLIVSSFSKSDTQLITIPIGIVNDVP